MQYNFGVIYKFINMGICSDRPKHNQIIYNRCYSNQQSNVVSSKISPSLIKSDQENTNSTQPTLPSTVNHENKFTNYQKLKPTPLRISNRATQNSSPQLPQGQQNNNQQGAPHQPMDKIKMPKKVTLESPAPIRQYKLMGFEPPSKLMDNISSPSPSPRLTHTPTNNFGSIRNGLTSVSGNSTRLEHVFEHSSKFMDSNPSPVFYQHGTFYQKTKMLTPGISFEEQFVFEKAKDNQFSSNIRKQ